MKTYHKILLLVITLAFSSVVYGQSKEDAKSLVNQGVALHDKGEYGGAIAKYSEAIKADPKYYDAYYEIAYTLYNTGKTLEVIPYLETAIKLKPNAGQAYDLLGSAYDDSKQSAKAIECYLKGINVDPQYQRLYYNLGVTYYVQKEYALAEEKMIKAIKLQPKHASSHDMYAKIMYGQGKKGKALLGWSSFLLLEPSSKRSLIAFKNISKIINYGIIRNGNKVTMNVSNNDLQGADFIIPATVIAATADQKGLSSADSLTLQLTKLYSVADMFNGKTADPFFKAYFVDYFKNLATTDNMPAFSRYITLKDEDEDNLKTVEWFKDHADMLTKLATWVDTTERKFE